MTFSIYDVATEGVAIWNETQSVQVSNGIFNVQLGSIQPLPLSVFMQDSLYLSVQVGADPEMAPRQRITSGSYSYKAAHADKAVEVEQTIIPVGSIIAWAKSIPSVPELPEGWVECNGQALSDPESPLNGQVIPDLNGSTGTQRFLRGSTASGATGGTEAHKHIISNPNKYANIASANPGWAAGSPPSMSTVSTLPSYYEVVWIIKTK